MGKICKRKSYGIICIRWNPITMQNEVLMVRKKTTYYFTEFMMGKCSMNNIQYLKKSLNEMTGDEKFMILSRDFDRMWYMLWGDTPLSRSIREKHRELFERNFPTDKLDELEEYIRASRNGNYIWEAPKGKLESGEKKLDCAIREFYEETGFTRRNYHLLCELDPYTFSVKTSSRLYTTEYFIAITSPHTSIECNTFSPEISECAWMSLSHIHSMCNKNIYNTIKKIMEDLRGYNLRDIYHLTDNT